MKTIIMMICVATLSLALGGCSSETKQEKMWDTSVAADSDFINLDTGGTSGSTTDTLAKDTAQINQ